MKWKNTVISMFALTCILMPMEAILADEKSQSIENTSDTREILNSVGLISNDYDIIDGKYIIIDTTKTQLYKTFKSNDKALTLFAKENEILKIKEKYHLGYLTNENWKDYYNAAIKENESYAGSYEKLVCFFDIYENEDMNNEIMETIQSVKNKNSRNTDNLNYEAVNELLPYTSTQIVSKNNEESQSRATRAGKSLSYVKMKAYADKWTYSYNSAFPKYSADCTNFVSQIINAGGKKENVNWGRGMKTFKVADRFAKHFGVRVRTKSLKTFSSSLKAGDIALIDSTGDGSYNHAGFVYDKGAYKKYGSKYYHDFKIAQHTGNWMAWASSSKNNWENNKGYWGIMTITQ